ncbi:hypothetical protein CEXT_61971 [Caerostris extrusa]|uniref:Uncharacterized protein n=1 Tax=Caerostris extrusa TaxID=172846 RepID=A0AAV4R994_CAEEX|nr:hypothetical protein CEXT_61971 [Caerostris extrusa]
MQGCRKGKDQTRRKLPSCQPIDWRDPFCKERQRSHSAGHANHFRDEDMEINGSVRPGYGDRVSEGLLMDIGSFQKDFGREWGKSHLDLRRLI